MYVCVRELADSDKPFGSGSDVPNSAASACFLIKKKEKEDGSCSHEGGFGLFCIGV